VSNKPTDEVIAKMRAAGEAVRTQRREARAATRIVTADFTLERVDEYNWAVIPVLPSGDTHFYSTPVAAAVALLKRTTDAHLCRHKARTIADIKAAVERAEQTVTEAILRVMPDCQKANGLDAKTRRRAPRRETAPDT
jgi:hypothetical protein